MRKVALVMAIMLVISMPLTASATPRALGISPTLAFNGTTAACEVSVVSDKMSDYIEVTMRLMYGSYCEASWSGDGYGYVYMLEYDTVAKGHTYDLVVEVKVNGIMRPTIYESGTC